MNWFDIILIILLLVSMLEGWRRGLLKEIIKVVGMVIVLYLSFILMNPLGDIFFKYLPFFSLHIIGLEISALNILLYQIIAFLLIAIILYIILNFILTLTGLLSKITGLINPLKIPFKILGAIAGLVTGYIIIFLILLVFSIPLGKIDAYRQSQLKDIFLNNKILLTKEVKNMSSTINEVYELTENISDDKKRLEHSDKYNVKALDIMLKNHIVSIETVDQLVKENKIHNYNELENILKQYRKEN